ncbi:MAG: phage tail terminator protein [Gammaproteobacteria bacterium]
MNLFAAEQLLIDKIKADVTRFNTVDNPSVIAGLTDLGPLLPACIVMPGAGEVKDDDRLLPGIVEYQDWHLVVIVGHQYDEATNGQTESIAGELVYRTIKAISGFKPETSPNERFLRPFVYLGREEPEYGLGYVEFPLLFRIKKVTGI